MRLNSQNALFSCTYDEVDNPTRIVSFHFGLQVSIGQDEKEEGRSADAVKEDDAA